VDAAMNGSSNAQLKRSCGAELSLRQKKMWKDFDATYNKEKYDHQRY